MAMSKRDYEVLAGTIRESKEFRSPSAHAGFAVDLAIVLEAQNPSFNPIIFVRACQPRWTIGTTGERVWDRAVERVTPVSAERG